MNVAAPFFTFIRGTNRSSAWVASKVYLGDPNVSRKDLMAQDLCRGLHPQFQNRSLKIDKADQSLIDLLLGHKRAFSLAPVEQSFVHDVGNGLTNRDAADLVSLAESPLRGDTVIRLQFLIDDLLAKETAQLRVEGRGFVKLEQGQPPKEINDGEETTSYRVITSYIKPARTIFVK